MKTLSSFRWTAATPNFGNSITQKKPFCQDEKQAALSIRKLVRNLRPTPARTGSGKVDDGQSDQNFHVGPAGAHLCLLRLQQRLHPTWVHMSMGISDACWSTLFVEPALPGELVAPRQIHVGRRNLFPQNKKASKPKFRSLCSFPQHKAKAAVLQRHLCR